MAQFELAVITRHEIKPSKGGGVGSNQETELKLQWGTLLQASPIGELEWNSRYQMEVGISGSHEGDSLLIDQGTLNSGPALLPPPGGLLVVGNELARNCPHLYAHINTSTL